MKISDWLDQQEAAKVDVSQIELPQDLDFEQDPDETIYFEEIKPCSLVCKKNHPFAKVERYGHWYRARGQDKKAGIHSNKMSWRLFTRDKELALKTAKARIE